jgi:DedD protein
MNMDEQLKKRLIGGAVLVALVVIFLPMLLDDTPPLEKAFTDQPVPANGLPDQAFLDGGLALPPGEDASMQPVEPVIEAPPVFVPPRESALTETLMPAEMPRSTPSEPPATQRSLTSAGKGKGWVVQLVSLSNEAKANDLVAQLQSSQFAAFVQKAVVGGKRWYRVRIGPEPDRRSSESTLARMQSRGLVSGLKPAIVRHP